MGVITIERLEDWRGQEVVDSDGVKLGKLEEVFYVQDTVAPALATVKSGLLGRGSRTVPLAGASVGRDYLRIAATQAQVESGPKTPSHDAIDGVRERRAEEARARAETLDAQASTSAAEAEQARRDAEAARQRAESAAQDESSAREQAERARREAEPPR